jgi:hypothetical protein
MKSPTDKKSPPLRPMPKDGPSNASKIAAASSKMKSDGWMTNATEAKIDAAANRAMGMHAAGCKCRDCMSAEGKEEWRERGKY